MSFTYTDPGASARDAVRFAVGDTDARRPQLQDAEVLYCLGQCGGDIGAAAVMACEAIIASLGRMCDQTVGSVSKSYSQLQANYKATLGNLRRAASTSGGIPIVGGTSRAANAAPYGSYDYVRPQFTTRMMSTPRNTSTVLPNGGRLTASPTREPGEEG